MSTDPCWLPDTAFAPLGSRRVLLAASGPLARSVRREVARATSAHGGALLAPGPDGGVPDGAQVDLLLAVADAVKDREGHDGHDGQGGQAGLVPAALAALRDAVGDTPLGEEAYVVGRAGGLTAVLAGGDRGLLYGTHHVVRLGERAFAGDLPAQRHEPTQTIRMLDHWDNMTVHPVMGQVERGYAGGSLFYEDGRVREDLSRVAGYARLLASIGVNAVGLNNVNVHREEAHLLTTHLPEVARLAAVFRDQGVRVWLSVAFSSPMTLGGLDTADPLDERVQRWWADAVADVYEAVPDFGGFVIKADSEGQPGPFGYGRDHADGANCLARALAPHGGTLFWRAFVYNHRQDWRDRSTDRARAAYDTFAPLDGRFDDNVVLQVKYGPMDFQTREPVSPVIAAMPRTRVAVELQVTQEYTGQQQHVCYLGPQWSEILDFRLWGDDRTVADVAAGRAGEGGAPGPTGGLTAVSNVGTDEFWTGHPLAQANLYAYGRLAWDARLDPLGLLDEWVGLTYGGDAEVRRVHHEVMDESWRTYEMYTAPLGVGFMVSPARMHYGPDVDGYEYSPWGTYHFADRDGVGVDRTRATGTGYTGQYPPPWRDVYESLDTCPDELLLFFHHVPYRHRLHSGTTVIQHVYDTHFAGLERVERMARAWAGLRGRVDEARFARVSERLEEQLRSAREWRDQVNTYFWRKSGVPDERGRRIY